MPAFFGFLSASIQEISRMVDTVLQVLTDWLVHPQQLYLLLYTLKKLFELGNDQVRLKVFTS